MTQNKKNTSTKSETGNKKTTQRPAGTKSQGQKTAAKKKQSQGTAGRTSQTAGKSQNRRKQTAPPVKEEEVTYYGEIILWILAGICIFLFLSSFGICGKVGNNISGFFFGIFGITQFVMPFVFFFVSAFLVSNAFHFQAVKKVCYAFLLSVSVSTFFQMFVSMEPESAKSAFEYSKAHKWGGGYLGGGVVKFLSEYLGVAGTFLVVIISIIIFTVLTMEKSVVKVVHTGGQKVVEGARKLQTSLEEENARNELERARARKGKKDLYHSMKVYETKEPEEEKSKKSILGKKNKRAAIEEITMEYEWEQQEEFDEAEQDERNQTGQKQAEQKQFENRKTEVKDEVFDRAPSIFDKLEEESTSVLEPVQEVQYAQEVQAVQEEEVQREELRQEAFETRKQAMVELKEEPEELTESEEEAREVLKKLKPREKENEKEKILEKKTINKSVYTQKDNIPTAPRPIATSTTATS